MKPREVMDRIVNGTLRFPLGNIRTLKKLPNPEQRNIGYPVSMLVMSSIEMVGSLIYRKNCPTERVSYFFRDYMSCVDARYGVQFNEQYTDENGELRDSLFGSLLYVYLRCPLAHIANAVDPFPIDAQDETYTKHLNRQCDGSILIHGYQLYIDFMKALQQLYLAICKKPSLRNRISRNIDLFISDIQKL